MDIENYTFEEFKALARQFHGYPAPGLMLGGYMVALAKKLMPEGTLFEAISETRKCLPDAVQLLTPCSMGNQWLTVRNLGRYAVTLYDKYTGEGIRVSLDFEKMKQWPELHGWIMKLTPKAEQNEKKLLAEIEACGDAACKTERVRVSMDLLGHKHSSRTVICPLCGEGFPESDGAICRACQGETYYSSKDRAVNAPALHASSVVRAEEAIGRKLAHDMTMIKPGEFKGAAFKAGQILEAGDLCRLHQIGRFEVAVEDGGQKPFADAVHENEAAELFARRMAGPGVAYALPPREGKIDFQAEYSGMLAFDAEKLMRFNLVPDVMCAARHDGSLVQEGKKFAGTRAIPLYLPRSSLQKALEVLGEAHLFSILPLRRARLGILVTGTEIFNGLIEDKFIPVMRAKARQYGCEIVREAIVPDDKEKITAEISAMKEQGIDILITTGGMSVDPGDVTRPALLEAGLSGMVYGMPVLPGAMAMTGTMAAGNKSIDVIGVPACALFFKTTVFDLLFPRILAGRKITRAEAAKMGEGGYCLSCQICTFPKCPFGK